MDWTELSKQGLLVLITAIAVWIIAGNYWQDRIETAPIVSRDTVTVRDTILITIEAPARLTPDPRIDTILTTTNCDSLVRDLSQIANLDTVVAETRVEVSYVPLDHRFTLSVTPPPRVVITNTKLVYAEPHWLQYVGLGASALVTGWGIADENPYMVAGGLAGVTIVSITF